MTVRDLVRDLVTLAALSKSTLLSDAADELARLDRENRDLQNRLWAADRAYHHNDPWETAEDG